MPDIRTMRNFNNFGNNDFVQNFWNKKFKTIPGGVYAETNHTLSKCGLVENIMLHGRSKATTLIVLRRDLIKQCVSYVVRNDFGNITLAWQWYLHPSYPKKIINPEPYLRLGNLGLPLWYCYEMAARQEYYLQKFSNKIHMVEVSLDEVVTDKGAKKFYGNLGFNDECVLPPVKNANKNKPNVQLIDTVRNITDKVTVDVQQVVRDAVKAGFTF